MTTDKLLFEEGDLVHPDAPDRHPDDVGVLLTVSYRYGNAQVEFTEKRFWKEVKIIELWPLNDLNPVRGD